MPVLGCLCTRQGAGRVDLDHPAPAQNFPQNGPRQAQKAEA